MADPTYIPPPKEVKISYITSVHPIWAFLLGVVVSGAAVYQVQKEIAAIDTEIPLKTNIRYLSRLIIIAVLIIAISLFLFGFYFRWQLFICFLILYISVMNDCELRNVTI